MPTWNYVTAHVHGVVTVHDDPAWVGDLVRQLTDRHEAGRATPWSVDDAPPKFFAGQLRAIVGVELAISGSRRSSSSARTAPRPTSTA